MRRVLLMAMVAAVVIPFAARAQSKADFSGTWTLDTAKSDPAPQGRGGGGGGGGGSVTIKQTGTELAVTSEGRQGPQTMAYKLDGSESSNEVMGRGGAQTVKSKAKWDGSSLVIETTRDFQGMPITTKKCAGWTTAARKWSWRAPRRRRKASRSGRSFTPKEPDARLKTPVALQVVRASASSDPA